MNRYIRWIVFAGATTGWLASAEMVITSPVGLSDEKDVVLGKTVDAVKEFPVDTVKAVGDVVDYTTDELRNAAHGVVAPFKPEVQDTVRANMLMDVEQAWSASGRIQLKTFPVKEALAKELTASAAAGQAKVDARSFFKNIEFPEGCSADYWPEFNRLVVNQTSSGMIAVVEMLAETQQNADYRQVSIETKFVDVEQKSLNELGFNWTFNDSWKISENWTADLANQTLNGTLRPAASALNGAGAAGTMTLTKGGWLPLEMKIRALEQSGGADLLSAPSITTADGKAAEIWAGDREKMPASFGDFSQSTSVAVEYKDWKDVNLGVYLKVKPVLKKGGLIDLELNPEVIELADFDEYSITPDNASMLVWAGSQLSQSGTFPILNVPGYMNTTWQKLSATLGGGDPNTTANSAGRAFTVTKLRPEHEELGIDVPQTKAFLPVFRVRKIATNLTVADGSTVGMGGLIYDKLETYKDKVPVLGSIPLIGRLFRSEGERSVKRNLMIFVTATKVDVSGRHSTDQMTRN